MEYAKPFFVPLTGYVPGIMGSRSAAATQLRVTQVLQAAHNQALMNSAVGAAMPDYLDGDVSYNRVQRAN
jgi:hypothetical protein